MQFNDGIYHAIAVGYTVSYNRVQPAKSLQGTVC